MSEKLADVVVKLGYDSEELFCGAFVDEKAFESWLGKLAEDEWSTRTLAARLRFSGRIARSSRCFQLWG